MSFDLAAWPPARGYMLNHSAGLPPVTLQTHLAARLLDPWTIANDQVWPVWLEEIQDFRAQLARVMNTEASSVCPQLNVSAGLSQVLGALPASDGRRTLLIAERAFPSLGFVFSVAQRMGFELKMIPRAENTLDPAVWDPYLNDEVHCVLLTHVHSNTSECHDIATLADLARQRGAISVVDVAQSIGVRTVDAPAWNVDFIAGSCLKWLCGGSGAGFLWVHPDRIESCEPRDVGWFSHRDPFEFDINHFEYAQDATRFWGGTPSVAPCITAAHSIRALLDLGLNKVEAHNRELTEQLCRAVPDEFQVSPLDSKNRGGSVVLNYGEQQEAFAARLSDAGIFYDMRKEGLRLSPHLYNTEADIYRIIDCLP
ncbi:MAG: aminotransferase class V-fold PLP-dependent enzyme [Pseudomonadota bacterium]